MGVAAQGRVRERDLGEALRLLHAIGLEIAGFFWEEDLGLGRLELGILDRLFVPPAQGKGRELPGTGMALGVEG